MAKSITVNGTEYTSSVQAAKALVASGKTVAEATKALKEAGSSITYQSVYAYTAGNDKTQSRRAKYRILALGKSGRQTASQIATKTGTSTSKVVAMLKKAQIEIVTKEALAKAAADAKAVKQAALDAKKAEREAAKAAKAAEKEANKPVKAPKATKAKKAKEPVVVVEEETPVVIEDELNEEEAAMALAMADMMSDGELDD